MSNDSPGRGIDFDRLADSFVARLRKGERPGLSEYVERYPQFADEIMDLFPALAEMEGLKPDPDDHTGSFVARLTDRSGAPLPTQLGDYRILRRIGEGGMGVVYEARRESLSAHVALKVLHQRFRAQGTFLRRFRNEARSAARLHHTNIVPVFDFGDHDGILYYVMQYIPGQGLDRVLADVRRLREAGPSGLNGKPIAGGADGLAQSVAEGLLTGRFDARSSDLPLTEAGSSAPTLGEAPMASHAPSASDEGSNVSALGGTPTGPGQARYHREVARIGAQVAEALAHAHSLGVLHRDIKPSNLLLDARGDVWVADFGLAKFEDGEDLTDTGDLLGTLRYMAPERLEGRSDRRSDIYALGATLYEMIALRPAFDAPDRARLLRQILDDVPLPLRKLDRRVPRDLETILHKAMARDASARYATAGAMAADLRLFLQDRPIAARRSTAVERTWLWCRRNPAVAAMAASLILVFLVAFAAVTTALIRARTDRRLANDRLIAATASETAAKAQKALADTGFAQARAAVDDYLTKVTESKLLTAPGLQPLRRDLLGSALKFYNEFLNERRTDASLRAALADVHLKVSRIQRETDDAKAAQASAKEAVRLYEALVREHPDDPEYAGGLLDSLNRDQQCSRAVEVGEALVRKFPARSRARELLADAYNGLYVQMSDRGNHSAAIKTQWKSLALRESLVRKEPTNARYQSGLGIALNNLGVLLGRHGRMVEALSIYRRAANRLRVALELEPNNDAIGRITLNTTLNILSVERNLGMDASSLATNREGLEWSRALSTSNPQVIAFAVNRFQFAQRLGDGLVMAKQHPDALAAYREAIETARAPLLRDAKTIQAEVAAVAARSAELMDGESSGYTAEQKTERDRLIELAMTQLRQAVDGGTITNPKYLPSNSAYKVLRDREDFRALQAKLGAAGKNVATGGKQSPVETKSTTVTASNVIGNEANVLKGDMAAAHYARGVLETVFGEREEARKSLEAAREVREALVRDEPRNLRHACDLGMTFFALGDLNRDEGRYADAFRDWERGRDLLLPLIAKAATEPALASEAWDRLKLMHFYLTDRGLEQEARQYIGLDGWGENLPRSGSFLVHARSSVLHGDLPAYRRACEQVSKLYAKDPERDNYDSDLAMLFGLSPASGIDPDLALKAGKAGLRIATPTDSWPRMYLALARYRAGRHAEALPLVEQIDKDFQSGDINPYRTYGGVIRAMVLHKLGRGDEARRLFQELRADRDRIGLRIMQQPAADAIFDSWGWAFLRIVIKEASALIDGRDMKDDPWTDLFTAWAQAGYGRPEPARAALLRAATIPENDAALHAVRGHVHALLGDVEKARTDRETALRLDPDNFLVRFDRGRDALAAGHPEDAATDLVAALSQLPEARGHDADRVQIDALLAASDAAFARSVALRPDDPQLWVARGRFFAWHGRWKEAAHAYGRGVEKRPIFVDWTEYGAALVLANDLAGYREFCQRVTKRVDQPDGLKGGPWDEAYSRGLAVRVVSLYPDSGVDPKLALKWAQAVFKEHDVYWTRLALAQAVLRSGDAERAARLMNGLIANAPDWQGNFAGRFVLALCDDRRGKPEDARHSFESAEAEIARIDREPARRPYPQVGYYIDEHLAAKVFQREARALLASKAGDVTLVHPAGVDPGRK